MEKLENFEEDKDVMYRDRAERLENKANKKNKDKSGWFNKKKYVACLFVPPTPGGELAKNIRQTIQKCRNPDGKEIKFVEEGSVSLKQQLQKSDHNPALRCTYQECPVCTTTPNNSKRPSRCHVHCIGYELECIPCSVEGKNYLLRGNFIKCIHKGEKHKDDQRLKRECSVMARQAAEYHNSELTD